MTKWERLIVDVILIVVSIYLDIAVFGPLIEENVELGVNYMQGQVDPIVLISFRLLFDIIAIGGVIDIIREIYLTLRNLK